MIDRLVGGKIPISIGTAMIFENPEFDIRKWPNLLYVNLRTLYRNYVASIPKSEYGKLDTASFTQTFLNEVSELERIIKDVSANRIRVYFFYPHYKQYNQLLPKVKTKQYNPDMFDDIEVNMWDYVKREQLLVPFFYEEIDTELPRANEPTLLLSSFVIDLLSSSRFPVLYLLESYTGKIKPRQEWGGKLKLGKAKNHERTAIPFTKFTIQIFGDKSGFFKGADDRLRGLVRNMAKEDNWTPVTSLDKIKYSISKIKDTKIKEILYSYL